MKVLSGIDLLLLQIEKKLPSEKISKLSLFYQQKVSYDWKAGRGSASCETDFFRVNFTSSSEKVLDLGNKFKLHDLSIATKKFEDRLDYYDEKIKISKFRHQRRMSLGRFIRETKFKKENQRMQKLANTIARTDDLIDALSDHMLEMEVILFIIWV